MRWLADECIAAPLVAALRAVGHDVRYAVEDFPAATGSFILEIASRERRLLLTDDKDFGELIFNRISSGVPGIVLMRISDQRSQLAWPRLRAAIARFGEALFGRLVVVEEARFRSRPLNR